MPCTRPSAGWRGARFTTVLLLLLACSSGSTTAAAAGAVVRIDRLPAIAPHAQQVSTDDLAAALQLSIRILRQHNVRLESTPLAAYTQLLSTALEPGCCDFFAALPLVKGLAPALAEVVALRLPSALRPVVRRSFVAAVWLLQRSRYFQWDSSALSAPALSGFYKLYEQHMEAAAGRPVSFHHVSKTGGTSLCSVAWQNGCRGPGMSKRDNCLLDPALDGPLWVLRHDVAAANGLVAVQLPGEPPGAASKVAGQQQQQQRNFDWFMYQCPAQQLATRAARCSERQEAAVGKAATFFASENMLPQAHGTPEVCEAFTSVIILRDAVSVAVSLMAEASLVYSRLLRQRHVVGWGPPKWDLAWWQQRAPVVVSSYAARTLLGPSAYCPPALASPAPAAAAVVVGGAAVQAGAAVSSSAPAQPETGTWAPPAGLPAATHTSLGNATAGHGRRRLLSAAAAGSSSTSGLAVLQPDQVQAALAVLASFDVVLELGSLDLMDLSLAKLLGWSAQSYSGAQHKRPAPKLDVPSWQQLQLLARQQAPAAGGAGTSGQAAHRTQQHEGSVRHLAAASNGGAAPVEGTGTQQAQEGAEAAADTLTDLVRRMLGEAAVRRAYAQHGAPAVLMPLVPGMQLPPPPQGAVQAALAALDGLAASAVVVNASAAADGEHAIATVVPPANATARVHHVWPRHGVLLSEAEYQQLWRATGADRLLHQHARVMQLLDAAWVASLMQQRRVRRMLRVVEQEVAAACGFAGLNHLQ